jgi:hypothetical protein
LTEFAEGFNFLRNLGQRRAQKKMSIGVPRVVLEYMTKQNDGSIG